MSALLDAAQADDAVAEALNAKDNPVIRRIRADERAEAVLKILAARGIAVSPEERQEIVRCRDLDRLDRWLLRATQASSAIEVTKEP